MSQTVMKKMSEEEFDEYVSLLDDRICQEVWLQKVRLSSNNTEYGIVPSEKLALYSQYLDTHKRMIEKLVEHYTYCFDFLTGCRDEFQEEFLWEDVIASASQKYDWKSLSKKARLLLKSIFD